MPPQSVENKGRGRMQGALEIFIVGMSTSDHGLPKEDQSLHHEALRKLHRLMAGYVAKRTLAPVSGPSTWPAYFAIAVLVEVSRPASQQRARFRDKT